MKKILALLLVTILVSTAAFAAGQADGDSQGVTITVMAPQDQVRLVEEEAAAQFEELTGNRVVFNIIPADQYDNLLSTKLNSGQSGDIFLSQSGALNIGPRYNPEKNLIDLSGESWVDTVDASVLDATSYNGNVYGLQIWNVFQVWSVVYNKTIFNDLGLSVPGTYDEFVAVCENLQAAGVIPLYSPVSDGWHHVLGFAEMGVRLNEINSDYYQLLNENEITLAEIPEALTLVEQIDEIYTEYSGENFLADEFANGTIALGDGDYAMMINRVVTPQQIEADYPGADYGADDFGSFVLPLLDNQIVNINPQGPTHFIFKSSENVDVCKEYLDFIASRDILQGFVDNEPTFTTLPFSGLDYNLTPQETEFFDSFPTTGTVLQAAVKYIDPQWMDIGKELTAMFTDQITPLEVLQNIDKNRARQAEAIGDEYWK